MHVAAATESADRQVLSDHQEQVAGAWRRDVVVVLRDRAADRNTPESPQRADRGLEVVPAHVVEVHVDPFRRRLTQQLRQRPAIGS